MRMFVLMEGSVPIKIYLVPDFVITSLEPIPPPLAQEPIRLVPYERVSSLKEWTESVQRLQHALKARE